MRTVGVLRRWEFWGLRHQGEKAFEDFGWAAGKHNGGRADEGVVVTGCVI